MSLIKTQNFKPYKSTFDGMPGYIAGLPGYPRNFSRDVILAGLVAENEDLLSTQIEISSKHQGADYDEISGEEPGKIHHEYPGVHVRKPYTTTYNACDTTALYLVAIEELSYINEEKYNIFKEKYLANIESAASYIERHTTNNIFWEYPPKTASGFSVNVTYWKDSILPATKSEPDYPVTYALAHFQAARGIKSAASILGSSYLKDLADKMFRKGIEYFLTKNYFCVMKDQEYSIKQGSSDEVHILYYIPETYKHALPIDCIVERARKLYTPAGIACTPENISDSLNDKYHGYVVWPFEQAFIHKGCIKFGLEDVAKIAHRCAGFIEGGYELIHVKPSIEQGGNDRQLWSVAAKDYFENI